jgi:hypothetical protein
MIYELLTSAPEPKAAAAMQLPMCLPGLNIFGAITGCSQPRPADAVGTMSHVMLQVSRRPVSVVSIDHGGVYGSEAPESVPLAFDVISGLVAWLGFVVLLLRETKGQPLEDYVEEDT